MVGDADQVATAYKSLPPATGSGNQPVQLPARPVFGWWHATGWVSCVPSAFPASTRRPPLYAPGLPGLGPARAFFRDPLGFHVDAYRRCGAIYRIRLFGRTTLVLAGIEANRFVWENDSLWDFGASGAIFRENFGPTYLTQLDGEAHAKKRRRMQSGFRPQALLALAPAMSATMV